MFYSISKFNLRISTGFPIDSGDGNVANHLTMKANLTPLLPLCSVSLYEHLPFVLFRCLPPFPCYSKLQCDVTIAKWRCFALKLHRQMISDPFHRMSHQSIRKTTKMITDRFVLNDIRQDIHQWVDHWLTSQASKIHKHTRIPLSALPLPC